MTNHLYSDVLRFVDAACTGFISDRVAAVGSALGPAAYSLLGLYVILWGLASMRGLIKEPIMEAAVRTLKIGFIFGIAFNLATYNDYITQIAWTGPQELSSVFSGETKASGIVSSLDQLLTNGFLAGAKIWRKGGILDGDFGMYLLALFVWAITLGVTAYTCFLLCMSKIALALIIGIGPLFILSLLFQPTAVFFNGWVKQLANFGCCLCLQ